MGVVYLALDFRQGHTVALKTIIPERQCGASEVERFLREARILQQLAHPHIVAFREMGELCGQLYFAMDFVAGVDARALLQREGPLPIKRAVRLIAQALEALHHAHERGFVHRDVKPANLLVVQRDATEAVKVLDFGLARTYQMSRMSGLTMMGEVGGTVPFMAPEQLTNFREARPPVDQYAAAATLYHLLTGKYVHDFPADFQQRFLKILQDDPVPLRSRRPDVPEAVASVIHRALERSPEKRYPNAAAFGAALLQAVGP
jgi:serine/threonine-protein kinase